MKKSIYLTSLIVMLTSCEKSAIEVIQPAKQVTFDVSGDFEPITRLSANGSEMTDLWLFDYMDGSLQQSIHQTPSDANWGNPTISMSYGTHTLCFVAARGESPTVNEGSRTITWEKPKDTFWTTKLFTVSTSTSESSSVTLNRVATKLKITVNDEVPAECESFVLTPSVWWHGLDYENGVAVSPKTNNERTIAIPYSYIGTSGQLSMSIYGISDMGEWTTDVHVQAVSSTSAVLGQVTLHDVPFTRNRSTEYSGNLFAATSSSSITLDDTWQPACTATW